MAQTKIPEAGLEFMIGRDPQAVLIIGGSAALVRAVSHHGHRVTVACRSEKDLGAIPEIAGITTVVAAAENLPFHPCQFDTVLVHQTFHTLAPGLVLSEIARVLRPGGHVTISYLVRDDTIPWVQKLAAIVQQLNPEAMRSFTEVESVDALLTSKYFPATENTHFRMWIDTTRTQLINMSVAATPDASEDEHELLREAVADLYDKYATGIRNLRLPYSLQMWRGWVDHAELTAPIEMDDSGLIIPV